MEALLYLDFVKCAHEGTRRMRDTMQEAKLPAPEFRQVDAATTPLVRVVLRKMCIRDRLSPEARESVRKECGEELGGSHLLPKPQPSPVMRPVAGRFSTLRRSTNHLPGSVVAHHPERTAPFPESNPCLLYTSPGRLPQVAVIRHRPCGAERCGPE